MLPYAERICATRAMSNITTRGRRNLHTDVSTSSTCTYSFSTSLIRGAHARHFRRRRATLSDVKSIVRSVDYVLVPVRKLMIVVNLANLAQLRYVVLPAGTGVGHRHDSRARFALIRDDRHVYARMQDRKYVFVIA